MLKKSLTAIAALGLAASPALAQSSASSLSIQNARASAETAEANDVFGGGPVAGGASWILPALVGLAAIIGILALAGVFDDDEAVSP
jgi:hypothetical protein